jgi:WD40 repeat protein
VLAKPSAPLVTPRERMMHHPPFLFGGRAPPGASMHLARLYFLLVPITSFPGRELVDGCPHHLIALRTLAAENHWSSLAFSYCPLDEDHATGMILGVECKRMKEKHDLLIPRGSGQVIDMAWSSDGKKLAAVTDRGWLLVWYVHTRDRFVRLKLSPKRLFCVAWNRRGRALAVGDGYGALYRVSRLSSNPVVHCHGFTEPIRRISWSSSPVGRCLVVAGCELILMDESGAETHLQYASQVLDAAWAEDGRTLAVVCADGLVEVVDAEQESRQPVEGIPAPQCLSWRKDGQQLAIGTEQGYVHLCDPRANTGGMAVFCTRFPIRTVEWGSDGLVLKNDQGHLAFLQEQDVLPLDSLRPTPTFALNVAGTQLATVQRGKVAIAAF